MTAFELRSLALISFIFFKEVSWPDGKLTNRRYLIKKAGRPGGMSFYVHEVGRNKIVLEDLDTKARFYNVAPRHGSLVTLMSEERTFNEIWIEEMGNPYMKGRDNYGRFEIRVDSINRIQVKDMSESSEYEYEIKYA